MKIGIGVLTYNRPEHLKNWCEQFKKYSNGMQFMLAEDGGEHQGELQKRKGIAFRTNEILKWFKETNIDYGFIFNDDCLVIKQGWAEFFIDAHKKSGQHHFLYLIPTQQIKPMVEYEQNGCRIINYNNCGGVMAFITKEVIEKVGAYGEYPQPYGYEHAAYSQRIAMANLNTMGAYICPDGASEYIYAMDWQFNLPFNKMLKHKSTIMDEIDKLPLYLQENQKAYMEDLKTIYKPL